MDNKNKEISTEAETKNKEDIGNQSVGAKIQRIVVSNDSWLALKAITDKVNDGFNGGRVNQTEVANWIIARFQSELDEIQIKEIRAEHFDEVAMLESVLRQAKESGKVPTDFKALLQKQLGLEEPVKRRAKSHLTTAP
jgi:chromatin remodeling complex protein RSC6